MSDSPPARLPERPSAAATDTDAAQIEPAKKPPSANPVMALFRRDNESASDPADSHPSGSGEHHLPCVMGIVNVTPDSFSDGGLASTPDAALRHARRLVEAGADMLDVGGESTRPGAPAVAVDVELERVIPVIERLASELNTPISVDTHKPEVMRAAVSAGAAMINDVNALRTPGALEAAAGLNVPVCLMHMQGDPRTMQRNPQYRDVVDDIIAFLGDRAQAAIRAGIDPDILLIDPGFGFGKTVQQNFRILRELGRFKSLGFPILVGMSRKSMIGKLLDLPVSQRMTPSVVLAALAMERGADVLRVHDVAETRQALRLVAQIL